MGTWRVSVDSTSINSLTVDVPSVPFGDFHISAVWPWTKTPCHGDLSMLNLGLKRSDNVEPVHLSFQHGKSSVGPPFLGSYVQFIWCNQSLFGENIRKFVGTNGSFAQTGGHSLMLHFLHQLWMASLLIPFLKHGVCLITYSNLCSLLA
jgi:hypothetical protein